MCVCVCVCVCMCVYIYICLCICTIFNYSGIYVEAATSISQPAPVNLNKMYK
jgi:hypothetical protein